MNLTESKCIVYTAQSKKFFFARMIICKFVLEHDSVPLNPFNVWGYFLYELVERDLVRRGNNNIVRIVDETWVFGPISDGVLFEIQYSMELKKPIRFFTLGSKLDSIVPINDLNTLEFEEDALINYSQVELISQFKQYTKTYSK